MKVVTSELALVSELDGKPLGFVPTMGALHDGHLSLVRRSVSENMYTVVSIFVNPLQFGKNEDLAKYPRPIERDLELLSNVKADYVFLPKVDEFYRDLRTRVSVSGISDLWEGAIRPGHFEGVATVVCKLFQIVRPKRAYFGLKDFQQCAVIRKMVRDLSVQVELDFLPTVRESDGLAMSSRNAYLDSTERSLAPHLFAALMAAKSTLESRENDAVSIEECVLNSKLFLEKIGITVDYVALVNQDTMEPAKDLSSSRQLVAAVRLGATRLIDNVEVGPYIAMS